MKKIIVVLWAVCLIGMLLVGCNSVQKDQEYNGNVTDFAFTLIESGSRLSMYKENTTGVLYLVYHAGSKAGLTVMLDNDGKPLTYDNWTRK